MPTRKGRNEKELKELIELYTEEKLKNGNKCLLVDVEATCWRGHPPNGMFNEIIEIGVTVFNYHTYEIEGKRSILVKPKFSEISEFCTELTTITQKMLDEEGVSFNKACEILISEYDSKRNIFMSWGDYDRTAFEKNCEKLEVEYPFGKTHFNQKALFSMMYKMKQEPSVQKALKKLGLEFEGTAHRGVDDSYNSAIIFKYMLDK